MLESHAQNLEDVILWRALAGIVNGTYVDIGAQHPTTDSVSFGFYKLGWRGLHVEPNPEFAEMLRCARSDEIVVEAAVGAGRDMEHFFRIPGTGLSTCVPQLAHDHQASGYLVEEIKVQSVTLADIFACLPGRAIHWLKIDVEGMECAVLEGWGDVDVRPWIVVVEAILPRVGTRSHDQWEHHLFARGYRFAYFDGINRFYVSGDHQHLLAHFGPGPNAFDQFQISPDTGAPFCSKLIAELDSRVQTSERAAACLHEAEQRLADNIGKRNIERSRVAHLRRRIKHIFAAVRVQRARMHEARVQNECALDGMKRALENASEQLRETMQERDQLLTRSRGADARIVELQSRVDELWRVADGAIRELATVHASFVWRVTRPLRMSSRARLSMDRSLNAVWSTGLSAAVRFIRSHSGLRAFSRRWLARFPKLKKCLHRAVIRSDPTTTCPNCPKSLSSDGRSLSMPLSGNAMPATARWLHTQIVRSSVKRS